MEVGKIEFGAPTDPIKIHKDNHFGNCKDCDNLSKELEELMEEMEEEKLDYVVPQFKPIKPEGIQCTRAKEEFKKGERKKMSQGEFDEECRLYGSRVKEYAIIDNIHKTPWSERDKPCSNPYPQKPNALDKQVGGSHYKQYKIQPYEFFIANQTPHHKAAIIRRILRYDHPTGKGLEDLKKIQHEIELIIQLENWEDKCGKPTAKKEG